MSNLKRLRDAVASRRSCGEGFATCSVRSCLRTIIFRTCPFFVFHLATSRWRRRRRGQPWSILAGAYPDQVTKCCSESGQIFARQSPLAWNIYGDRPKEATWRFSSLEDLDEALSARPPTWLSLFSAEQSYALASKTIHRVGGIMIWTCPTTRRKGIIQGHLPGFRYLCASAGIFPPFGANRTS